MKGNKDENERLFLTSKRNARNERGSWKDSPRIGDKKIRIMPIPWNNILVVTLEELVPKFYSSYPVLKEVIHRAEKRGYGIRRVQKGGNGRVMLIDFDSLPREIQEAIGDPRKVEHILEKYYKTDQAAVDFYTNFKLANGLYIKDNIQEEYITNASTLKSLQALKLDREREILSKTGTLKGIMKTIWSDAMTFKPFQEKRFGVVHTLPRSEERFKQTYNDFQNQKLGYISLISDKHGNTNALKVTDDVIKLLNNMFATQPHKPTYTEVAGQYDAFLNGYLEVINNETGELYDHKEFKKLSEATVYNWLRKWENKIATFAIRSGDRQRLMAQFKPYHSLEQPQYSGSIISVDDRQPAFEYAKGKRMWFYNGIDLASEAFTTWVYGKTKDGIILDFYRQMVRNYAEWGLKLPAEIECEMSLNSSFANTFLKEGAMFQYVRIEANNARGKRIEQYYSPLRYGLEKKREGWLARPFALSESNQAGGEKVPFVAYDKLTNNCLDDIETWNNMPHSVHKDKTRWEVFLENQHPDLKPTNYKAILPFLGYKTKTSVHAGILNLQESEWLLGDDGKIYFGERLINLMTIVEGQNIDVYWLDKNDGGVLKALIYIGDQYICEALPKPTYVKARIEQTAEDLVNRELMSKYVATIEAYQRDKKREIENVTIVDHRKITLNDNFKIARNGVVTPPSPATGEALPEPPDEFNLNATETKFKTQLKDRF